MLPTSKWGANTRPTHFYSRKSTSLYGFDLSPDFIATHIPWESITIPLFPYQRTKNRITFHTRNTNPHFIPPSFRATILNGFEVNNWSFIVLWIFEVGNRLVDLIIG